MTVEDFRTTVGPKVRNEQMPFHLQSDVCIQVHGTWNLHDMLPKDLDFFVMLSSLAGVMGKGYFLLSQTRWLVQMRF